MIVGLTFSGRDIAFLSTSPPLKQCRWSGFRFDNPLETTMNPDSVIFSLGDAFRWSLMGGQ